MMTELTLVLLELRALSRCKFAQHVLAKQLPSGRVWRTALGMTLFKAEH